jgi:hypothetical protein
MDTKLITLKQFFDNDTDVHRISGLSVPILQNIGYVLTNYADGDKETFVWDNPHNQGRNVYMQVYKKGEEYPKNMYVQSMSNPRAVTPPVLLAVAPYPLAILGQDGEGILLMEAETGLYAKFWDRSELTAAYHHFRVSDIAKQMKDERHSTDFLPMREELAKEEVIMFGSTNMWTAPPQMKPNIVAMGSQLYNTIWGSTNII